MKDYDYRIAEATQRANFKLEPSYPPSGYYENPWKQSGRLIIAKPRQAGYCDRCGAIWCDIRNKCNKFCLKGCSGGLDGNGMKSAPESQSERK